MAVADLEKLIRGERDYLDFNILSKGQKAALAGIVEAVRQKAQSLPPFPPAHLGGDLEKQIAQRHVMLIDGPRGAGKTHVLTVARQLLGYVGFARPIDTPPRVTKALQAIEDFIAKRAPHDIQTLDPLAFSSALRERLPLVVQKEPLKFQSAALVLKPIFPADMEGEESPIVHILARLVRDHIVPERDRHQAGSAEAQELQKLIEKCNALSQSWMFARSIGVESILYNTSSFKAFSEDYGRHANQASARLSEWRALIERILNQLGYNILVVSFDETDSERAVETGILQILRSYLDHDRIVTVVAGNLRALRNHLVIAEHRMIGQASASHSSEASLRGLRDAARIEVEERLQKVFPAWQRYYLAPEVLPEDETRVDELRANIASYHLGDFDLICQRMLDRYRSPFIQAKVKAFQEFDGSNPELRYNDALAMENFVAWWLFRRSYLDQLRPRNPRHILSFIAYTRPDWPSSPQEANGGPHSGPFKRLAVILFEQAQNALLSHRFADGDRSVLKWLKRQTLSSDWVGKRCFAVNGRAYFEGSYTYDFIRFRIDLGLALPLKVNQQEDVPAELLPIFSGFDRWAPLSSEVDKMDDQVFGLAKSLSHGAAPANCIHMSDLMCLPEAAFVPRAEADEAETWEGRLSERWPRYFAGDRHDPVLKWLVGSVFPCLAGLKTSEAMALSDSAVPGDLGAVFNILKGDLDSGIASHRLAAGALLSDLRRAWLTMHVFASSVSRAAGPGDKALPAPAQASVEADAPAPLTTSPGEGSPARRGRDPDPTKFGVPTLETVQRIVTMHDELQSWFSKGPGDAADQVTEEDFARLCEDLTRPVNPKGDEPDHFYRALLSSAPLDALVKRSRMVLDENGDRQASHTKRLFRPTLLFIHALTPCIPALAVLAARGANDPTAAVADWRAHLRRSAIFVAFARQRLVEARSAMAANQPVGSMYIADFSWFSLFGDNPSFGNRFGLVPRSGLLVSTAQNIRRADDALAKLQTACSAK